MGPENGGCGNLSPSDRQVTAAEALRPCPFIADSKNLSDLSTESQGIKAIGKSYAGLAAYGPQEMQRGLQQMLGDLDGDGTKINAFVQGLYEGMHESGYQVTGVGSRSRNSRQEGFTYTRQGASYAVEVRLGGTFKDSKFTPTVQVERVEKEKDR